MQTITITFPPALYHRPSWTLKYRFFALVRISKPSVKMWSGLCFDGSWGGILKAKERPAGNKISENLFEMGGKPIKAREWLEIPSRENNSGSLRHNSLALTCSVPSFMWPCVLIVLTAATHGPGQEKQPWLFVFTRHSPVLPGWGLTAQETPKSLRCKEWKWTGSAPVAQSEQPSLLDGCWEAEAACKEIPLLHQEGHSSILVLSCF